MDDRIIGWISHVLSGSVRDDITKILKKKGSVESM